MIKNIRCLKYLFCGVILVIAASFTALSQQYEQQNTQYDSSYFSDAELAQILAPIALYPDSLLTHILIASTYPIEVIEAHRWLNKNDELSTQQLVNSVENFDWDASVKALIPFEQILERLSDNLSWTQQLGDAFLQDEAKLLETIQTLRSQAQLAGNLSKMDNVNVTYQDHNIIIEPVEPLIVYVPYYDTRIVYGRWYWASYPPVYWRPYPRVYVSRHRPFYWHSGVHISFNYFFSAFHWHNRHVVVVSPHRSHYYRPRHAITRGGYAKPWKHKAVHRRGVGYKTKRMNEKYYNESVAKRRSHHKYQQAPKSVINTYKNNTYKNNTYKKNTHKKNNNTSAYSKSTKQNTMHRSMQNKTRNSEQKNIKKSWKSTSEQHASVQKRIAKNDSPVKSNRSLLDNRAKEKTVKRFEPVNVRSASVKTRDEFVGKSRESKVDRKPRQLSRAQSTKVHSNNVRSRSSIKSDIKHSHK